MTTFRSIAIAGIITACASFPAASDSIAQEPAAGPASEVVLTSEVKWEHLNPARGDKSPKAGTLWGDRNGSGPTGFLLGPTDGFESPPHIHNVSYRGLVIRGLIHNDDPDAEGMWMPTGSFWTQPAGEVHITAAKGSDTLAYIEIEKGPYRVLPAEKAFDRGERPVNVDASNIVWLDASNLTWVGQPGMPASAIRPKVAFLWGNPQDDQLNGTLVKLPAGFAGEIQSKGSTFRAVVIQGQPQYRASIETDVKTLEPGSYFSSEGELVHRVSSQAGEESIIYVRTDGKFDVIATPTIRQYQFAASGDGYELVLHEVPRPVAGPEEVLVKVHATSLNRRDWMMLTWPAEKRFKDLDGGIPLSDGAGEVIAVGSDVTRFKVGDRVAGTFFADWSGGRPSMAAFKTMRAGSPWGGNPWGMLSEIVVTKADGLVEIPEYLSYQEAATLPCAAVTAWNGLFKAGDLQSGEYVLLEGTGGVSIFGLQFAAAAGAKPIITSSSNDKLERARKLGAIGTVNYRENPDWQKEVRALTDDVGVDHVLDIGGRDTMRKALEALAFGGHIALIGELTGGAPSIEPYWLAGKSATGIFVGSRADFEAMLEFMEKHQIHPVIDRVFSFDQAQEAYDFMDSGSYMGKIVITH